MLLLLLFFSYFSVSVQDPFRDKVTAAFNEAFHEIRSDFYISETSQAQNFSIAALTAIKLTRLNSNTRRQLPRNLCPLKDFRCNYDVYRSTDGTCNNASRPLSGSRYTSFSRRIHATYDDDINTPKFSNRRGRPLPPADIIAETIDKKLRHHAVPLTRYFIEFADFLYRDLAEIVTFQDPISCCQSNNKECFSIGDHGIDCYIRSAAAPLPYCSFGRREQMNAATSFLDAGPIYHLKHVSDGLLQLNSLFGDKNSLISIFSKEHNYVVEHLRHLYPRLDSQTLFEEAKKFVIAEIQHITYEHFLPILLGDETMQKYHLTSESMDELHNPNTLNEFGAVVGQFYKFMIHGSIDDVSENTFIFRHALFEKHSLLSNLILRGRDHGLATYSQWVEECGGGYIKSWDDIFELKHLTKIKKLFPNVRDVDLILLGLAENPVYGSIIGPTFGCILALQYQKTRFGDAYFYDRHLNEDQLSLIKSSASLSSILCRNGIVSQQQSNSFIAPDGFRNFPIICNSTNYANFIDFSKWLPYSADRDITYKYQKILDICIDEVNSARQQQSTDNFRTGFSHYAALNSYGRMMLAKDEAVAEANISFILIEATKKIVRDKDVDLNTIQGINIGTDFGKAPDETCNPKPLPCDPTNPYRTYTGWCNNLKNPSKANTFTELKRVFSPQYTDSIDFPRSRSSNGNPLPSPRTISNVVHHARKIEHKQYSHLLMEFGQFIDHDITHSPVDQNTDGTPLNCTACDSFNTVSPSCFPIPVPRDDLMFPPGSCLSFVRSLPAQKTLGYRNQMNQITAYLDGSVMYGSTKCEGDRLRTFENGKLKVTRLTSSSSHYGLTLSQSNAAEQDGCVSSPDFPCFIAGDDRNSQQTLLIAVHSVFHREHERVSTILSNINPHWGDEKVYQETRKFISAQFSNIVYSHYLPIVIGETYTDKYDLRPLIKGYYKGYDENCDASILQPFATSAFRLHSTITRFTPMHENILKPATMVVDLASEFINMTKIYQPNSVEKIIGGLSGKRQMQTDRHVDDSVRNFLFSDRGRPGTGLDLISINIQRGRDHGIAPYNYYREYCKLEPLLSFHSFFADINPEGLEVLAKVYESPEDIDLFTGIFSEILIPGAIVGPTAACIIAEQFKRLKNCDRFYYENGDNPDTRFTEAQLNEIRKTTLSSLICANTKLTKIAKDVFSVPDQFLNALTSCDLLPQVDFSKWKDIEDCNYHGEKIILHSTTLVTPCKSCTCTKNGLKCTSKCNFFENQIYSKCC
ncbi:unnamed protein product [Caenorhabditis angaria]|uniref:Uncharacterized protein n=1 Tax=Caenorhabditis angaria TaxID=860376 RepID=A0A9P1I9M0_9PELO|nr:unnamed protein product [Caenorhabditis angaria]